jgi:branched-chain amino acid transport system permease protein
MQLSFDLLGNAVVSGLLLGGFYAGLTVGLTIVFGMLDIVNIAHPAFVVLGCYIAWSVNAAFGIDPLLTGLLAMPAFFLLGSAIYQLYHAAFERRGAALQGLAFFFGLLFVIEVGLVLAFGVDYRLVEAPYAQGALHFGTIELPFRLLVPCLVSLAMIGVLELFLVRSFTGRAILAVAQDPLALRLMAADPRHIRRIAFGIAIATTALAGAILIVIQPVEPSIGRDYIGRVFAICVVGGLGSIRGTLLAGFALGIIESMTATFYGPSWSPAVAFGLLLAALAVRPAGLLGRR